MLPSLAERPVVTGVEPVIGDPNGACHTHIWFSRSFHACRRMSKAHFLTFKVSQGGRVALLEYLKFHGSYLMLSICPSWQVRARQIIH